MAQGRLSVVCFTGHRQIPRQHALLLPALLEQQILLLMARGATVFRAGGAIGFDMLASLKVLELREQHPALQLQLMLPCPDQTKGWDEPSRRAHRYLTEHADSVICISDRYHSGCMLARDRRLVDGSDLCLAYCAHAGGGTAYTCSYANKKGVEILNLFDLLSDHE